MTGISNGMNILINYWAVVGATVAAMVVGALWYGPLFGKQWRKLANCAEGEKHKGAGQAMAGQLVATLLTAYVLAHFAHYANANSVLGGAKLGVWVWLGFVVTTQVQGVLFERKPRALFFINASNMLLTLLLMGMIIAVWR